MEITYAKDYTIIHLRIEEDLEYIEKGLEMVAAASNWGMLAGVKDPEKAQREIRAIIKAIQNMNERKDLQLRFS